MSDNLKKEEKSNKPSTEIVTTEEEKPIKEDGISVKNDIKEGLGKQVYDSEGSPNISTAQFVKKEVGKLEEKSQKEIERINYFFIGFVIFIGISFLIQMFITFNDRIKDKELYLNYINLYKDFYSENKQIISELNNIKIEQNNLKNDLENIKKCVQSFGANSKCFK